MTKKAISAGAVHSVPADLRKGLASDAVVREKWEDITPLARNEWICWVISVKKPETRKQHIAQVCSERKEACAALVAGPAVLTAEVSRESADLQCGEMVSVNTRSPPRSPLCHST